MSSSKKRKVDKCSRVNVELVQKPSEYVIKTDPHDITLPAVIVFSGTRGSGKTYACIKLMKHFETKRYITRTFLLCPTRASNDLYSNLKTLQDKDCYTDDSTFLNTIQYIIKQVKEDWHNYKMEKWYAQVYQKWLHCSYALTLQEETLLDYKCKEPPKFIPKPAHLLIVDDAQGTSLFSNGRSNALNHAVIKHRHIPLTIALLAQSWVGIPRVIRLNTTQFAVFKTGDKTQLKQIYDTFGTTVEMDQFNQLYKEATDEPHGFLFIDTVPKKEYMRFRSGFNHYLLTSDSTHV